MLGRKVLVVEDSNFMCQLLKFLLSRDFELEFAHDGKEAIEKVKIFRPDAVTMDIDMPVMSGLEALEHIMEENPVPVIMVSVLTVRGAKISLRALEMGAFDVVAKPGEDSGQNIESFKQELITKIKVAILVPPEKLIRTKLRMVPAMTSRLPRGRSESRVVIIGSSTGGPTALQTVISRLPADFPAPILVVQHMPPNFTRLMAERLNSCTPLKVKEADDGENVVPGKILVAPGGMQMILAGSSAHSGVVTRIIENSPISTPYKPSINVLFQSAAEVYGKDVIALILTGMGSDGLDGGKALKEKGATLVAEAEESCIVYGMSKCVVEAGLADKVLPVTEIGDYLVRKLYSGEEERGI